MWIKTLLVTLIVAALIVVWYDTGKPQILVSEQHLAIALGILFVSIPNAIMAFSPEDTCESASPEKA